MVRDGVQRIPFKNLTSYVKRLRQAKDDWAFVLYLGLTLSALWRRHVTLKSTKTLDRVINLLARFDTSDEELRSELWRLYDCLLLVQEGRYTWGWVLARSEELISSGLTRQWQVKRLQLEIV